MSAKWIGFPGFDNLRRVEFNLKKYLTAYWANLFVEIIYPRSFYNHVYADDKRLSSVACN
ncbi:MAG: hypothetical protein K2X47_04315 [Bdellovibrionales bacterium]|nr:hypothetical protein [Bdellovibrionales bacterium]